MTLLPQDQVQPGLRHLFPLEPPMRQQLWLLTHPDLRGVARIRALMEWIADALHADPRLAPAVTDFSAPGTS